MTIYVEDLDNIITTTLTEPQKEAMLASAESMLVMYVDVEADPRVTTIVRDQLQAWLAAHFCAISERRVKEESADGIRTVFDGKTEMGLDATLYGQQVKMLDPTGKLAKVGDTERKRLRFHFSTPRDSPDEP